MDRRASTGFTWIICALCILMPRAQPSAGSWHKSEGQILAPALDVHGPQDKLLGGVLYGQVRYEDGSVVQACSIKLRRLDGSRSRSCSVREGRGYSFAGVAPGEYQLLHTRSGTQKKLEKITVAQTNVPRRIDLEISRPSTRALEIEAWTFAGVPAASIFYSATQVWSHIAARMRAVATPASTSVGDQLYESGARGVFGMGSFRPTPLMDGIRRSEKVGTLTLEPIPSTWISLLYWGRVVATREVTLDQTLVRFEVEAAALRALTASLRLRAVDGVTGQPVVFKSGLANGQGAGQGPTSDGLGFLQLESLAPCETTITLSADGYAKKKVVVSLAIGQDLDLGVISLYASVQIAGHLVDTAGRPLRGCLRWGLLDRDTGKTAWVEGHYAPTEKDGGFRIPGLAPGEYLLRTWGDAGDKRLARRGETDWCLAATIIDVRSGSVSDAKLQAVRSVKLSLQPQLKSKQPYAFELLNSKGWAVFEGMLKGRKRADIRLSPGSYTLVLKSQGSEIRRRHLSLISDDALVLIED